MDALEHFAPSTRFAERLMQAGWNEQYRWDPEVVCSSNRSVGFEWHDASQEFLARFGGLTLRDGASGFVLLHTDPVVLLSSMATDFGKESMDWAGQALAAVGTAHQGEVLLMYSESHRFFGRRGDLLIAYGDHFDPLLDRSRDAVSAWN